MVCPICGRLYCDHSPAERGQSMEEMLKDMYSPHIIGDDGRTYQVSENEREKYLKTGKMPESIRNKKMVKE